MKYRATFSGRGKPLKFDLEADNEDDAFRKAYRTVPDAEYVYDEMSLEEIADGPKNIGIEFQYRDTCLKRDFTGHLVIRADTEEQAKSYYMEYFHGKRFWFDAGKTENDGKCVRGKILDTYFATCPGYDADATRN